MNATLKNRLLAVKQSGTPVVSYGYDALGQAAIAAKILSTKC